jgi:hypothetical protein
LAEFQEQPEQRWPGQPCSVVAAEPEQAQLEQPAVALLAYLTPEVALPARFPLELAAWPESPLSSASAF